MKVLGIYHAADLDGKCSGAIILRWCNKHGHACTLHGMNYGDPIPDDLESYDKIIVSDFSLDDMSDPRIVWYDHHKIAIAKHSKEIAGTRDTTLAGCELTWHGLFGTSEPRSVWLLGAYDCWRWQECPEPVRDEVLKFQYGMRLDTWEPDDPRWEDLFTDQDWTDYINMGATCLKYQSNMMERIIKTGVILEKWGKSVLFVNCQQAASTYYEGVYGVDMVAIYWRHGDQWRYSLRALNNFTDVSRIALEYGGGGHAGAAGWFSSKELIH